MRRGWEGAGGSQLPGSTRSHPSPSVGCPAPLETLRRTQLSTYRGICWLHSPTPAATGSHEPLLWSYNPISSPKPRGGKRASSQGWGTSHCDPAVPSPRGGTSRSPLCTPESTNPTSPQTRSGPCWFLPCATKSPRSRDRGGVEAQRFSPAIAGSGGVLTPLPSPPPQQAGSLPAIRAENSRKQTNSSS